MQIAGYLRTSLIEWPGKITSVIFTPGCNFRCPFCHNADLVADRKRRITPISEDEILTDLEERKKWIDAVVVTGGEPTLQKDLDKFLRDLGEMGFLKMIHTNGTRPEVIKSILNLKFKILNYVCMDLKNNFENYEKTTNVKVDIEKIKESMRLIIDSGMEYEFRTTVVPGLHDLKNLTMLAGEIKNICRDVRSNVSIKEPKWFLQQFSPKNCFDPKYKKVEPYSPEVLESFQKELQKIIPGVEVRGI